MKLRFKELLPKLFFIVLLGIGYLISSVSGIGCIWRHFFGIQCPGCGFTRSILCALHLDFTSAFHFHPMFWSFPFMGIYFLIGDRVKSRLFDGFMLAIVYRLFRNMGNKRYLPVAYIICLTIQVEIPVLRNGDFFFLFHNLKKLLLLLCNILLNIILR